MSDTSPQGQAPVEDTGQQDTGQVEDANSLYAEALAQIPEDQRALVEPHFKAWDGQVTQRFQSIQDKYKPYEDLGSLDDIKSWKQAVDLITSQPDYVLDILAKELGHQVVRQGQTPPQQQTPQIPGQLPGQGTQQPNQLTLPPEIQERMDKQEKLLMQMGQAFVAQQTERQNQEEEQQLDQFLGDLHKKHNSVQFDDDWVLLKIHQGMEPDQAVQAFAKTFQIATAPPAPPPLGGGGSIPGPGKPAEQLSRNETQDLVAQFLAQAANQNQ